MYLHPLCTIQGKFLIKPSELWSLIATKSLFIIYARSFNRIWKNSISEKHKVTKVEELTVIEIYMINSFEALDPWLIYAFARVSPNTLCRAIITSGLTC
jgi:hypothetical protein